MSHKFAETENAFMEAMKDVTPIKQDIAVTTSRSEPTLAQTLKRQALEKELKADRNYLSVESVTPLDPMDMLSYKKDGVQDGVFKNLRLGKYQIDARLSLQHLSVERARDSLYETIQDCHQKGVRTLLIQHGLGKQSKPFPALIKSYVYQWLQQMPEVLAFHSALKHHGGLSSLYVLLKKNREEKLANRELHKRK